MDSNEWFVASSKSKKKSNNKRNIVVSNSKLLTNSCHIEASHITFCLSDDVDEVKLIDNTISKLIQITEILRNYDFNKNLKEHISVIISLGIGNFMSSPLALLQLAILLNISKINNDSIVKKIYIFEPAFTNVEKAICHKLGIYLLKNKFGKYSIVEDINTYLDITNDSHPDHLHSEVIITTPDITPTINNNALDKNHSVIKSIPVITTSNPKPSRNSSPSHDNNFYLFYMPHCPYRLYCNVLWQNWFHLDRIFILGNR
jgi:hypothetical protein